jgi:hypothetical protein
MTSFIVWHLTYRDDPPNLRALYFLYRDDGVANRREKRMPSLARQIGPRLE